MTTWDLPIRALPRIHTMGVGIGRLVLDPADHMCDVRRVHGALDSYGHKTSPANHA